MRSELDRFQSATDRMESKLREENDRDMRRTLADKQAALDRIVQENRQLRQNLREAAISRSPTQSSVASLAFNDNEHGDVYMRLEKLLRDNQKLKSRQHVVERHLSLLYSECQMYAEGIPSMKIPSMAKGAPAFSIINGLRFYINSLGAQVLSFNDKTRNIDLDQYDTSSYTAKGGYCCSRKLIRLGKCNVVFADYRKEPAGRLESEQILEYKVKNLNQGLFRLNHVLTKQLQTRITALKSDIASLEAKHAAAMLNFQREKDKQCQSMIDSLKEKYSRALKRMKDEVTMSRQHLQDKLKREETDHIAARSASGMPSELSDIRFFTAFFTLTVPSTRIQDLRAKYESEIARLTRAVATCVCGAWKFDRKQT